MSELPSGSRCLCVPDSLNFTSLEGERFDSRGFMDTGPLAPERWMSHACLMGFHPVTHPLNISMSTVLWK